MNNVLVTDTINKLRAVLYSMAVDCPLQVLTRPVSDSGMHLATRRGFKPFHPGKDELGDVFVLNINRS